MLRIVKTIKFTYKLPLFQINQETIILGRMNLNNIRPGIFLPVPSRFFQSFCVTILNRIGSDYFDKN